MPKWRKISILGLGKIFLVNFAKSYENLTKMIKLANAGYKNLNRPICITCKFVGLIESGKILDFA